MSAGKHTPYEQGFIEGMTAYAISKNGTQVIGNDRPLRGCIEELYTTWNFNPPADATADLLTALKAALELARVRVMEERDRFNDALIEMSDEHGVIYANNSPAYEIYTAIVKELEVIDAALAKAQGGAT